ncbi:Carboxyl-terminal-processing peptidase 1, chloroplastic [Linum perenne]
MNKKNERRKSLTKMRSLLCSCSATLPSLPSSPELSLPIRRFPSVLLEADRLAKKVVIGVLTGALSINLLITSPTAAALESPILQPPPLSEYCREEEAAAAEVAQRSGPPVATNEKIVEEAWEIVNGSFLDVARHRWTPETWQRKKDDILSSSIQSRTKAHEIIRRMLSSLGDPYTRFLSPAEFSRMARYDMTGIGINLREVAGENGEVKLRVLGVLLDGPANAAGVRQGDEILAVNGEEVQGKSAFEVSSLLQGPNETFVTIKVKHGKCGPVQSLDVQRQVVAKTPVFYRLEQMDNGNVAVGYVRLKEFNALARKDLVIAMKRLQDMGASYFILDLRDNRGGLVQAGIEVAKLFLNEGETVIYTAGRDSQYQTTVVADTAPLVTSPVIVLVNSNTASASEIVASALHDNCKAVLVGERTFGKGLIQSVFELDDGSGVAVTVGKYVTPNHMDINGNGIDPDYRNFPAWGDVNQRLSQCKLRQQG